MAALFRVWKSDCAQWHVCLPEDQFYNVILGIFPDCAASKSVFFIFPCKLLSFLIAIQSQYLQTKSWLQHLQKIDKKRKDTSHKKTQMAPQTEWCIYLMNPFPPFGPLHFQQLMVHIGMLEPWQLSPGSAPAWRRCSGMNRGAVVWRGWLNGEESWNRLIPCVLRKKSMGLAGGGQWSD